MNIIEKIRRIFCKLCTILPIWAYGLECNICKKSFRYPEDHHMYVVEHGLLEKHTGKIPVLRARK